MAPKRARTCSELAVMGPAALRAGACGTKEEPLLVLGCDWDLGMLVAGSTSGTLCTAKTKPSVRLGRLGSGLALPPPPHPSCLHEPHRHRGGPQRQPRAQPVRALATLPPSGPPRDRRGGPAGKFSNQEPPFGTRRLLFGLYKRTNRNSNYAIC